MKNCWAEKYEPKHSIGIRYLPICLFDRMANNPVMIAVGKYVDHDDAIMYSVHVLMIFNSVLLHALTQIEQIGLPHTYSKTLCSQPLDVFNDWICEEYVSKFCRLRVFFVSLYYQNNFAYKYHFISKLIYMYEV